MPLQPERLPSRRPLLMASTAALLAIGFGLTLLIFYPGIMTFDAKYVYEDIAKGTYGDWQSPVMVWLWGLIDPVAPGADSMFLLTATMYWLGFGILSLALASRGKTAAPQLNSSTPNPSSNGVSTISPPVSPQTPTQIPAACAASTVCLISRSTAGCVGS